MSTTASTPRLGSHLEAERCTVGDLHFFDLGFLGDTDQALLVCGADPDHEYRVRVYTQRDLPGVRDLREDDTPRVLELGRAAERAVPRPMGLLSEEAKEPQTAVDSSVQTELEAQFSRSAEILGQVKTMFNDFQVGACPADWEPRVEVTTMPTMLGGSLRVVPLIVTAHTCFFGNMGVVVTTLPVQDPVFGGGMHPRVRACSTQFKVTDTRKVSLKHSLKSTKIGLSFGLGFMPQVQLPTLPGTKDQVDTSPKEGDKAFENGEEKKDPATGSNVSFDFGLAQSHAKLKFDAWQRLEIDVGPDQFVCRDA